MPQGMELVRKIESAPTDGRDRPIAPVVIAGCGEL